MGMQGSGHSSLKATSMQVWVALLTMLTTCGYPPLDDVCGGQRCLSEQVCAANQDVCIDSGGCGDDVISPDKGEVCDDGNILGGDGCSADCTSDETCGNGIQDILDSADPKELCDDGNRMSGDGCSANCTLETCGNGVPDLISGEECDTAGDTQACDDNCTLPRCGDGYTNPNFVPSGASFPEQCDSGGDSQMCDNDCTRPVCGDGYVNNVVTEECDDGNNNNSDSCPEGPGGTCKPATCGDGFVRTQGSNAEECDNGSNNSNTQPDACRTNCRKAFCGDGVRDSGEQCDINNGCSGAKVCTSTCLCL